MAAKIEKSDASQNPKDEDKRRKVQEKLIKAQQSKEAKRIKKVLSFPAKALLQLGIIAGGVAFIIKFFNGSLLEALYFSFLAFVIAFVGIGAIVMAILFTMSEAKKKEKAEKRRQEIDLKREQELKREEELARLTELEGAKREDK